MNIKLLITLTFTCFAVVPIASAQVAKNQHNSKELLPIERLPAWFKDSIAREKKVKKKSKLKLEQFNVNAKVAGKAKLIEESEGSWYYHIDIGTDSPVECFVFSEFDGPANSMYGIVENSMSGVEELNGKKLSGKSNFSIGTGIIGDTPYLLFDSLYILGEGDGQVLGTLKALSAETDNSLQVCMHNEIGYRKTFFTVFESFIKAFIKNEESPDFFENVIQIELNGIPVGFARERFKADDEGDIKLLAESSFLVPVDSSSVLRSDSESTSWSTPGGELINALEYSIENAVLTSNLSIGSQDGRWQVKGVLQGKEVEYDLNYGNSLLSDYGSYVETKDLGESDEGSRGYAMWLTEADPSSVTQVVLRKVENDANANFQLTMGPIEMKFMAEDSGAFKKATLQQGPVQMGLNRVYIKGSPTK